ncbi:MAG: hypothetical protein GXP31_00375 [Kiritimatiellaeota bacterium]|nr:hypothetical protein [Kiritimatiellota bacterium]
MVARHTVRLSIAVVCCGLTVAAARGLELARTCVAGGGATALSDGGKYLLGTTLGQPAAGVSTGGGFALVSGFWGGVGNTGEAYDLSGAVLYTGRQPGSIVVQVFLNASFAGAPVRSVEVVSSSRTSYTFANLPAATWYVRAFVDADGDFSPGPTEAAGTYPSAVVLDSDVTGVDIALTDPDSDDDQLPDWWEQACFGNLDAGPLDDPDDDGSSNLDEYAQGSNPLLRELTLTSGWNLISLPFRCSGPAATQLLGAHVVGRMWCWRNGSYQPSDEIKPLEGYWVYRTDPAPVHIPLDTRALPRVPREHVSPTREDTDGDGIADAWELVFFDTLADCTPDADPDRDGSTNADEFRDGTDPTRYVLRLRPGWNLISLADARPADCSPTAVLGGRVAGPAWVWNGREYRPANALRPRRGHWVFHPGTDTVETPVVLDATGP